MAKFNFHALGKNGEVIVKRNVESVDERELINDQKAKGYEVFRIKQIADKSGVKEFSPRDLANFSHELSIMLSSGLTAVRALTVMASQTSIKNTRLAAAYTDLSDLLKKGYSISEACKKQGGAFPDLLINAFYSGEASGNMPTVTKQMSDYYERVVRVNQKIKSTTTYPKVLLCMTAIIVIALFTFILPQFIDSGLFDEVELPAVTQFMFIITDFFTQNLIAVVIGLVSLVAILTAFLKTPFSRAIYDKYIMKLPIISPLVKTIYTSRFAATLSYLHNSGIMLTQAVPIAARATNNSYIVSQVAVGVRRMYQGEMLSNVLRSVDCFNYRLVHITLIGEETGKLGEVMTNMASIFEDEADAAISRMLTLLNPALLAVMAVIVGAVVISVMLPIFTLYQNL